MVHDLGTSGDKGCLFDEQGELVGTEYRRYGTYYPRSGEAEQRPGDWWEAVCETTQLLLRKTRVSPEEISCISWSAQEMGCIPVDRGGRILQEYVMIYVDGRAVEEEKQIVDRLGGWEAFYRITGQGLPIANYPVAKILWTKRHAPAIYERTDKFLEAKDYVRLILTGEIGTDYTDASVSGTLDIRKGERSTEILRAAGIEEDKLPTLHESTEIAGHLGKEAAEKMGLKAGIPVAFGSGDVSAAATGAGVLEENAAYVSSGTSCWAGYFSEETVLDPKSRVSCLRHIVPGRYLPHDFGYSGAVCRDWVKDNMFSLEEKSARDVGVGIYEIMDFKAQQVSPASEGLLFLPYMRGGEAPHHNLNMRGTFLGLSFAHTRAHFARAVIEGVAMNTRTILETYGRLGAKIGDIRMVGGGALSSLWRQVFADVLGRKILRLRLIQEANALGAAVAGGIAVGLFKGFDLIKRANPPKEINEPSLEAHERYETVYSKFKQAYTSLGPLYDDMASTKRK